MSKTEQLLAALMLAFASATGCACAPTCNTFPEDDQPVTYAGGATSGDVYMSSPWTGPLLEFPGGMQYTLEHHLGAAPQWIESYLAFSDDGVGGGGAIAQAAGNEATVVGADTATITVANTTCSSFFVLVVAGISAPRPSGADDACGSAP